MKCGTRISAHLYSDRSPIKQFCLMNLGQAGSSDGFIVERFKKLLWGLVKVFLEESIHLSQRQTWSWEISSSTFTEPRAVFALQLSPLCTSCSRPCLPVFAGCGCTRGVGGGWRNKDLGQVWCILRRSLQLLPPCTLLPSGGRLTSQPSRMGCSGRGGQQ